MYLFHLILAAILCTSQTDNKVLEEFSGGNPGYSKVTLVLYTDSTYYFTEFLHMNGSLIDSGKWINLKTHFYLNSSSKNTWTNIISQPFFRFEMQEFIMSGDTLKFVPKDKKDNRYYNAYYKLHRVTSMRKD